VAALAGGVACDGVPAAGSWDLLVNATPVGMRDASATPFPDGPFTGRIVYDLVYTPPVTRLLADAAVAGVETIGGLEMLVAQAERQAEFWTGARPPAGLLRATALAALSARGDA
jgi:shikimate 5-dehydrogenase